MIQVLWEYLVKPDQGIAFETAYASTGTWAVFFQKSRAYRGTSLLRDGGASNRYLTIDVWTNRASYEAFQHEHAKEYEELDRRSSEFTLEERCLGIFELL
jgi:heme-degrading monooxygenase HmoA